MKISNLIKKIQNNNIYAFIDASNLIYGVKYEGWKIDLFKLLKYLKERYKIDKAFYYAGIERGNEKQKKFYEKLQEFGYILRLKPVKLYTREDGSVVRKANCDVDLTFDAMRLLCQIKEAIFLTGDGDFYRLIKYFLRKNRKVRIIASGDRTAKELKKLIGDKFIDIKNLKNILEFQGID